MSCSRQEPKVLSKGFVLFGRSCCGGSWTDRKCRPRSWFTEQIWPVMLCLVEMSLWLDIIGGAPGCCEQGGTDDVNVWEAAHPARGVAWLGFWLCCTTPEAPSKGTEYFKATSFTISYQVYCFFPFCLLDLAKPPVNEPREAEQFLMQTPQGNPLLLSHTLQELLSKDSVQVELIPEKKGLFLKHVEYEVSSKVMWTGFGLAENVSSSECLCSFS